MKKSKLKKELKATRDNVTLALDVIEAIEAKYDASFDLLVKIYKLLDANGVAVKAIEDEEDEGPAKLALDFSDHDREIEERVEHACRERYERKDK
jgi:hypothetical protein